MRCSSELRNIAVSCGDIGSSVGRSDSGMQAAGRPDDISDRCDSGRSCNRGNDPNCGCGDGLAASVFDIAASVYGFRGSCDDRRRIALIRPAANGCRFAIKQNLG